MNNNNNNNNGNSPISITLPSVHNENVRGMRYEDIHFDRNTQSTIPASIIDNRKAPPPTNQ